MKREVKTPFFVISPKTYIVGDELVELAKMVDDLAENLGSTIFFTAPPTELRAIAENTKNVIVTAQNCDGLDLGRGMGRVPLESLKYNGVQATFLNHMESPMYFRDLILTINKAKELDILTIVCADSAEEARVLAYTNTDIILCEPNSLIGSGKISGMEYVKSTIDAIREINDKVLVMEGAGIICGADVKKIIGWGADGTGVSSILAKTDNKYNLITDLFNGLGESRGN